MDGLKRKLVFLYMSLLEYKKYHEFLTSKLRDIFGSLFSETKEPIIIRSNPTVVSHDKRSEAEHPNVE